MTNGWEASSPAWIAHLGASGDFSRQFILDRPMMERVRGRSFKRALDVGCGEGRFCRMLREIGLSCVGIDPTEDLLRHARERDPDGDYRIGRAESLDFSDNSFDLVVSYLSLIDIPDAREAVREMARVLEPNGTLLIANLTSFSTAGMPNGWTRDENGNVGFMIDNYLEERVEWVSWRGIRIQNWHRPLSRYMSLLLEQGLQLRHFAEPAPQGAEPADAEQYRRVPYFLIMEWHKPSC